MLKTKVFKKVTTIIATIYLVLLLIFELYLISSKLLTFKLFIIQLLIIFSISFLVINITLEEKLKRPIKLIGSIICVFLITILIFSFMIFFNIERSINDISINNTRYENFILLPDPLDNNSNKINTVGILSYNNTMEKALKELSKDYDFNIKKYSSISKLTNAPYPIFLDECDYINYIENSKDKIYVDYSKTPYFYQIPYKTTSKHYNKRYIDSHFTLFISGINSKLGIPDSAESELNLLLKIDLKKNKITGTLIPTETKVINPINDSNITLKEAGTLGIDKLVKCVEQSQNTNIDYYIKMNFTSFCHIINSLDGINVNSSNCFECKGNNEFIGGINEGGIVDIYDEKKNNFKIQEGNNKLFGSSALGFVRTINKDCITKEVRNENQRNAFYAISDKINTDNIKIYNFAQYFCSLDNNLICNFTNDQIKELFRFQLNNKEPWDIKII